MSSALEQGPRSYSDQREGGRDEIKSTGSPLDNEGPVIDLDPEEIERIIKTLEDDTDIAEEDDKTI